MKIPWYRRRDYVDRYEGRLTILQVVGFWLIALGLFYFLWFLFLKAMIPGMPGESSPEGVAGAFFMTMLGVSLAFPDMLKGQTKDISTMRIVVFMFANVICMLILKNGWGGQSLEDVGLDASWVWVIAFLFGAKAAQSYAENVGPSIKAGSDTVSQDITQAQLAELAVEQNATDLKASHPNVVEVSDTLKDGNACVTIYLRDGNTDPIPREVKVKQRSGAFLGVPVEVVTNIGKAQPHIGQATDQIALEGKTYWGSICCLVSSVTDPSFVGAVTSCHIFTLGEFKDLIDPALM